MQVLADMGMQIEHRVRCLAHQLLCRLERRDFLHSLLLLLTSTTSTSILSDFAIFSDLLLFLDDFFHAKLNESILLLFIFGL